DERLDAVAPPRPRSAGDDCADTGRSARLLVESSAQDGCERRVAIAPVGDGRGRVERGAAPYHAREHSGAAGLRRFLALEDEDGHPLPCEEAVASPVEWSRHFRKRALLRGQRAKTVEQR